MASNYQFLHSYERSCERCGLDFTTGTRTSKYCSERCRTRSAVDRRHASRAGEWLRTPVICRKCSKEFCRTLQTGPNKKYCSDKCAAEARSIYNKNWMSKSPEAMRQYDQERYKRHGRDTLITRLRHRYPDLPTVCETKNCLEQRVLEIAHKPEFKRNGGWRTQDKYERHMFWMLCPTCHRVLDFAIETPEQMGLF